MGDDSARRGWATSTWYVIESAARVKRAPLGLTRFGERLVLFRDASGTVRAVDARCPHRGADLSTGRVLSGELECPYHGFRFDGDGRCAAMPCEGRARHAPDRMRARAHHVREAHGFVWLWRGESEPIGEPEWLSELPTTLARSAYAEMVWRATLTRTMESMMDIHHFPHAHRRIGGGSVGPLLDPYEARLEDGHIRTTGVLRADDGRPYDGASGQRFRIDVRFPSLVHLRLAPRTPAFVACTPIDDEHTWIGVRYWVDVPVLGSLLAWLAIRTELGLVQPDDQRISETSSPREPTLAELCPVRADAGIVLWHRLADRASAERARRLPLAPREAHRAGP